MTAFALAIAFAVFTWWFTTGVVLWLDGLPRRTFRWSIAGASVLAIAALVGLAVSARSDSAAAAYCGFACAIVIWGWHELAFLTGWVTGPRRTTLPPGATGWRRFRCAVEVIAWHEVGIIATGGVIAALSADTVNPTGWWTYAVLWVMRTSAKLNLFFGVRNLSEEFLPPHLAYLGSYFRRRPVNWFFPLSVTLGTAAAVPLFWLAFDPSAPVGHQAGAMLAGTLLGLALLEHWFMVLPLPLNALWQWALRTHRRAPVPAPVRVEVRR